MKKEAQLLKKKDSRIECLACARGCTLSEGQIGFCGVRGVYGGKLYLLNYGVLNALHMDPIEKKPLVHFYPGSKVLAAAGHALSARTMTFRREKRSKALKLRQKTC